MQQLRLAKDKLASSGMLVLTILSLFIVFGTGIGLYLRSVPLIQDKSIFTILSSSVWKPFKGEFGFFPFIMGTFWVTIVAIIIAFPLCLLCAIYLSVYAHTRLKNLITPFIDLLSGIPPVVYGVWGVLVIVPLIQDHIAPHFVDYSSGYTVLAGGVVLAVMIFPLIISILMEVFAAIPPELQDASLSLGATQWQTVKFVLLRKALPGIIAATVLAISRAFGETIAVLMVCGNIAEIPHSIFDSAYPLPALIANNYGEMLSLPLYESALMFAAFILFIIILFFNTIARIVLARIERRYY